MKTFKKPVLGIILKGYPRISETFISNEILLLEKLGISIHIFSMRQPREPFCHESVKQIKAKVDYLPETLLGPLPVFLYHNILFAIKNPRAYLKALAMAFRRFLRTRKSATFKHLLQAGLLVHHFLPEKGIVHLHAHFAHSPTSLAMFASQLTGLPFSFTGHAKDIYTPDPRQLREKISLAHFVMTCTEYNKHHLMELARGVNTPIHRVYHGIDISLFSGGKERVPAEPYQILTVARLVPKKGLPTVLKAIKILCDQGISIHYKLIGDGDDLQKILMLIKELGLTKVTQYLGTLPHHIVLGHYQSADIFVLGCEIALNNDRDGIPNVFVESMAMGVPVVATNISGIPELIEDGKTGLLVPPHQPEEMAQAIKRVLTDLNLRKQIIHAAKKKAIQEFNNQKLIQELVNIYTQYLPCSQAPLGNIIPEALPHTPAFRNQTNQTGSFQIPSQ